MSNEWAVGELGGKSNRGMNGEERLSKQALSTMGSMGNQALMSTVIEPCKMYLPSHSTSLSVSLFLLVAVTI